EPEPVEPAAGGDGLVDEGAARLGIGDVADDHVRLATLELDQPRRLGGRLPVYVGARHRCALTGRQLGDGPAVAHGRVGLRGGPRAGAHHQDTTTSEPHHSAYRSNRPRAMTRRWISLVPSPMIISGASR